MRMDVSKCNNSIGALTNQKSELLVILHALVNKESTLEECIDRL